METSQSAFDARFYSASEAAKILGLTKNAVINRCQKGYWPGAHKAPGSKVNPNGQWVIPKAALNAPVVTQDVAVLTRQINPVELEKALAAVVRQAVSSATVPLQQEIATLKAETHRQQKLLEEIKAGQNRSLWQRLFG